MITPDDISARIRAAGYTVYAIKKSNWRNYRVEINYVKPRYMNVLERKLKRQGLEFWSYGTYQCRLIIEVRLANDNQ